MNHLTIEQFGEHHWELLSVIEAACFNKNSACVQLRTSSLRINPHLHPSFALSSHRNWTPEMGTRLYGFRCRSSRFNIEQSLSNGTILPSHDDIDCLYDLSANNLISISASNPCCVTITEEGLKWAALFRRFVVLSNERPCMFSSHIL